MEEVPMPLGKVLYESGDELHHAYFREHAKPGEAIKQPF
jgi:hypothetical protein